MRLWVAVALVALATARGGAQGAPRGDVVMFVAAHPDDETVAGPALARYAREGARVYLVYATDGRRGVRDHAAIPMGDSLARVRAGEMRCAAARLGAQPPVLLAFRDGIATGSLDSIWEDSRRLKDSLAAVLGRLRPGVVLTWGPDGGSGHPDHRMVSSLVTELYQSGGLAGVEALYYVGWPARAGAPGSSPAVRLPQTRESLLTFRVPVSEADWVTADSAFRCHWSQFTAQEMQELPATLRAANGPAIHFRPALPAGGRDNK